jgi:hypothetical protein
MIEPERYPTVEELKARAEAGESLPAKEGEDEKVYEPEEIVCTLTLDLKQTWVLLMLLYPYHDAKPDSWDIYRAACDVRRRLAEALGYPTEGR